MLEEIKKKLAELQTQYQKNIDDLKNYSNDEVANLKSANEELKSEIEKINKKISDGFSLPGYEDEQKKQKFSYAKAIKAAASGNWTGAEYEKEISDTIAKSVSADTGAAGGFLSPTHEVLEVIELAIANRPVLEQTGIERMFGLSGFSNITIPKLSTRQTAAWVGSEEAASESNPTFGEIQLSPKYLRCLSIISRELLKQEPGLVEPIVRREMGNASALKLEAALIYGTGTNKEPKGITQYSNVLTHAIGTNGGRFTWDAADEMVSELEENDQMLTGSLAFVTHPKVKKLLRQEKVAMYTGDTSGMDRVGIRLSDAQLAAELGYPLYSTTLIPSSLTKGSGSSLANVIFGDFSQVILAMWGNMETRVSMEAGDAFTKNQLYVASFLSCDIQIKDETRLVVCSDASTSA